MSEAWSYDGKYLGRFLRSGTASYHHEPELIFEYGTVYGDTKCVKVPKQYSWNEIIESAKVNVTTIAYFAPIYANNLYSYDVFLEIIEKMRDDQRGTQLQINQQAADLRTGE